jgi:hypothetical protein
MQQSVHSRRVGHFSTEKITAFALTVDAEIN